MRERPIPPARPPTQLYDWKRDKLAVAELVRPFPPVVGPGRGEPLKPKARLGS